MVPIQHMCTPQSSLPPFVALMPQETNGLLMAQSGSSSEVKALRTSLEARERELKAALDLKDSLTTELRKMEAKVRRFGLI